ncbi:MAG: putative replicase [Cressdnaviricota sp.]|nr:MAG: putative replicase [Cressdnaviricota sp.]
MSYLYALRLKALDGYAALFPDVFVEDRFTHVLHVHHTGKNRDNPHYHFILKCDYEKKDTLRRYLRSHFTLAKGNKHISLKDWDGDVKACSYLYHEDTPVTNVRGFTDEELEEFKTINEEVKRSQTKIPVILERVIKRKQNYKIYDHDFSEDNYYTPSHDEHRDIFNLILDELRKSGDWVPNKFQMERYINKVRLTLVSSTTDFRSFQNNLYNEMFPKF